MMPFFSARWLVSARARLLLLFIALVGRGFVEAAGQVGPGLFLVIGGPKQSCTDACAQEGLVCSYQSLRDGSAFYPGSVMNTSVVIAGGVCSSVAGKDRGGSANPMINAGNRCFGKVAGKKNFNCGAVSWLDEGRRLCSCFPASGDQKPLPPAPSDNVPPGYSLKFRDDFDGDDINTDNWSRGLIYDKNPKQHVLWNPNPKLGGPGRLSIHYDGYIMDKNCYVNNGQLELRNMVEDPPIKGTWPTGTFKYSTGFANSLHKQFFNGSNKGVFVELRALFPSGDVGKVWSAIWMVPESEDWPPEIDIWEYFGLFFNPDWGRDEMQFRVRYGPSSNTTAAKVKLFNFQTKWGTGWHTYGWHWTSQRMVWYINGEEVGSLQKGVDVPPWRWPNENMAFVLQNALMESIDDNDPAMPTKFPNTLALDWIACYEEN